MKQLLGSLAKLLHDTGAVSKEFIENGVTRLVSIIFKQESYVRVKPAIQALEYFLSKRLISAEEVVALAASWNSKQGLATLKATNSSASTLDFSSLDILSTGILDWVPEPDIAPAAGKLISCIFSKIKRVSPEQNDSKAALWSVPLRDSLLRYPEALEGFKQHVFPELFRIDATDLKTFLDELGLQELLSASVEVGDGDQMYTLLAALQMGKEIGLVRILGTHPNKSQLVMSCSSNYPL
jgi:hypothetical protein